MRSQPTDAITLSAHATAEPELKDTSLPHCLSVSVLFESTGEIEGLRERLRAMESREREREEEAKALKKALRNRELSLLSSTGGGGGNGQAL